MCTAISLTAETGSRKASAAWDVQKRASESGPLHCLVWWRSLRPACTRLPFDPPSDSGTHPSALPCRYLSFCLRVRLLECWCPRGLESSCHVEEDLIFERRGPESLRGNTTIRIVTCALYCFGRMICFRPSDTVSWSSVRFSIHLQEAAPRLDPNQF